MRTKLVCISIPQELLNRIDDAAKVSFESRSGYIRQSILFRLNDQHISTNEDKKDELQTLIERAVQFPTA